MLLEVTLQLGEGMFENELLKDMSSILQANRRMRQLRREVE